MLRHLLPVMLFVCSAPCLLTNLGCVPRAENSVVIYSAADREFSQPILSAFARRNASVEVVPQYDVEATKTVGLVTRIESESARPRADVFWNNEILHTLRLEQAGLLQPIDWDIPADWPSQFRSSQGKWVGIAARARVLLVNRELLPDADARPKSVLELGDPVWKGRCGVALPLFGTTATHFTILRDRLGDEQADRWFQSVHDNAVVLAGNKQVAQAVASGQLAFGLTDTDDALIEIDAGLPVEIIFPDQRPNESGTLRIPNTVCVLTACPHPVAARELANYLITADTEGRLAMGVSGQFPLRPGHPQKSRAQGDTPVRWMEADFLSASKKWDDANARLRDIFRN